MEITDSCRTSFSPMGGTYSYGGGARYASPMAGGTLCPELAEFHAPQHEYLALANATDSIARLHTFSLTRGERDLGDEHRRIVEDVIGTVTRTTTVIHELVATYMSFLYFATRSPGSLSNARAELSQGYRELLRRGELPFGAVDDDRHHAGVVTGVMTCAIACMNLPYRVEHVRFDTLAECIAFIEADPPDRRFLRLLDRLRPVWEENSILIGAVGRPGDNAADVQAQVGACIRATLPDMPFFLHDEQPMLFRDMAAELQDDTRRHGCLFLDGMRVEQHTEDTMLDRAGARLMLPEPDAHEPLDLSLKQLLYARGSLDEFAAAAMWCRQHERHLFTHVFAPGHSTVGLTCFASGRTPHPAPFTVECSMRSLVRTLARLPQNSVVLKIDERWAEGAADELGKAGHPTFVLVHDTRPRNVYDHIVRAARQPVSVGGGIEFQSDEFVVFVAYSHHDKQTLLAPMTTLGTRILGAEPREHFFELLRTCYSGTRY
ncbi:hypothetical protein [Streptomyces fuscichromogenes]|uniref:Uncharacterized protein n=1 Tax=Streptomyces fuscichromogenes TaxID=1324013 RepID=A0A918CUS5_9ACTN|nr:hypothetical protein [Streptomyces fuscichromogenes]GGN29906.1 hypothetical protein GCM10011578_066600 [Streptomyces fuscichromogenes]